MKAKSASKDVLHVWEVNGYVRLSDPLAQKLKAMVKSKSSYKEFARQIGISPHTIRLIDKKYTKISLLFRIINALELSPYMVEAKIASYIGSTNNELTRYTPSPFPMKITPLHIRLVSHIIGDGTIGRAAEWCQKDVSPLAQLQELLTGKRFPIRPVGNGGQSIVISKFIIKVVFAYINLPLKGKISKKEILQKLSELQDRDSLVQLVTAFIEDEGAFHKTTYLVLKQKDRDILHILQRTIDKLGYPHSKIGLTSTRKRKYYKLAIYSSGVRRFYRDHQRAINKYGVLAGLWKKRAKLDNLIRRYGYDRRPWQKLIYNKMIGEIRRLKRGEKVTATQIRIKYDLSYRQRTYIMRRLVRLGLLKRVKINMYTRN